MQAVDNKKHFDKLSRDYQRSAGSHVWFQNLLADEIEPLIKGKAVLDLGNGGFFAYNHRLASRVTVMDVSPNMLDAIKDPAVEKIISDARTMTGVEDESLDFILINQVLHHINDKTYKKTIENIALIAQRCRQKLKDGGQLMIIEPVLWRPFFRLERLFFHAARWVLAALKQGMIFFFSREMIFRQFKTAFVDAASSDCKQLRLEGWMDPMPALFPGVLKIPTLIYPTRFVVFRFKK